MQAYLASVYVYLTAGDPRAELSRLIQHIPLDAQHALFWKFFAGINKAKVLLHRLRVGLEVASCVACEQ